MDALPPAAVHCEAPASQDILLKVNGIVEERDFAAFIGDVRHLDGGWTVVSDTHLKGKRTFVLRARPNVTHDAVSDATANATARGWNVQVTFDLSNCVG